MELNVAAELARPYDSEDTSFESFSGKDRRNLISFSIYTSEVIGQLSD